VPDEEQQQCHDEVLDREPQCQEFLEAPGILKHVEVTKVANMTVRAHSASNARATVMAVVRTRGSVGTTAEPSNRERYPQLWLTPWAVTMPG
jgi:hypothetical protein